MQGLKPGFVCAQLGHSLDEFFKTYAKWINSQDDAKEIDKLNKIISKSKRKVGEIKNKPFIKQ